MPRSLRLRRALAALALLACALPVRAQDVPRVTRTFALENARVVQAPGRVLDGATVVVRDGLIQAVGRDVPVPYDAERIAADSLWVYAAFIDGLGHAGIPEPGKEDDEEEVVPGSPPPERAGIRPARLVHTLLDAEQGSVDALRRAGFGAAHVVPRDGMLPGRGAILLLGGDADAMVLRPEASLFVQFDPARGVYPSTGMAVMAKLRQLWREADRRAAAARAYAADPAGRERVPFDPEHEALVPAVEGALPVVFWTDGPLEAHRALGLGRELGFTPALAGLERSFEIAPTLVDAAVPLFLSLDLPEPDDASADTAAADTTALDPADSTQVRFPTTTDLTDAARAEPGSFFATTFRTHSLRDLGLERDELRARRDAVRALHYSAPARLHAAGARFGFSTRGVDGGDVRAHLRTIVDYGLDRDDALAALTTDAAALLGLEASLGTVEPGKIANLLVTTGDYFDEDTAVRWVFVDGLPHAYDADAAEPDTRETVEPAGTWRYEVAAGGETVTGTLTLEGSGASLGGSITSSQTPGDAPLRDVRLRGRTLTFSFDAPQFGRISAELFLTDDGFEGTLDVPGVGALPITGSRTPSRR